MFYKNITFIILLSTLIFSAINMIVQITVTALVVPTLVESGTIIAGDKSSKKVKTSQRG